MTARSSRGGNCIKIGLPGKLILWGLSDEISLRLENKSSLRPIPRESVFPEDLIGSKTTFNTYSLVKCALRKTYFKGLGKIKVTGNIRGCAKRPF